MQSSAERILSVRRRHTKRLWLFIGLILMIAALLGFILWFTCPVNTRVRWFASVGLVLDVLGATLVALPLFFPYRDPVKKGMQFLEYYEPHRSAAVVQHQEKLTLPMQVGAALFVLGFIFQLISQWA